MKVIPVASPHNMTTPESTSNQTDARSRAINALMGQPAQTHQEHPVANPNQISPEEMSVVRQATESTDKIPQETPVEAPTQEKEEPQQDPALTRQFAQLARQEKALRAKAVQQDQAYKQRIAELEAREQALKTQSPDLNQYIPKDRLKTDPLSVLDETGVSYDELTQQILTRQPTDPRVMSTIQALKAEIESLKSQNQEAQKTAEQRQQESYQAAIKQISRDVKALVQADTATFEAIHATNSYKDVVELIERTYQEDGYVMSVEDAAQEVENELVEELSKYSTRINKVKSKLTPPVQPEPAKKTEAQPAATPTMKTLTNQVGASRKLSPRERAILAMEGKLKG